VEEKSDDDEIPDYTIAQNTIKAKQENSSKTRVISNSAFTSKFQYRNYPISINRIKVKRILIKKS